MPTTLIPLWCISLMGDGPNATQPAASWDTAPAPTRQIQQRRYQYALAFVYLSILYYFYSWKCIEYSYLYAFIPCYIHYNIVSLCADAVDFKEKSRRWGRGWRALSPSERNGYRQRARAIRTNSATALLSEADLALRKEYIIRQISYWVSFFCLCKVTIYINVVSFTVRHHT